MSTPKAIVFTDWDGTVTLQDSNDYLTEHLGFGDDKRRAINDEILDGKVSFRDGFQKMLDSIDTPFPECIEFLKKNVKLDSGFKDFYNYCSNNGIPVVVISSGMKPVIYNLLITLVGQEAVDNIEIYSNDVTTVDEKSGKWDIVYRDSSDFGHDKSLSIKEYLAKHKFDTLPPLFYCGDGVSDLSAAKETNLLFAKHGKDLIKFCRRENIPYTEFQNFNDILTKMTSIISGDKEIKDVLEN